MDFYRMLREKRFWLSILLTFGAILAGTSWPKLQAGTALESGTFLTLAKDALGAQTALFVIPLASVLPCGEEYLRERQWNFIRFLLVRKGRADYILDRVLTAAISGALVWLCGTALAVLVFFLAFFGFESVWTGQWSPLWELLSVTGRVCLTASALSSMSAGIAALSRSVYLAMGLPFLSYYACMILRERYLEELYSIDPSEWILAAKDWGSEGYGLWIFLILLNLLMAVLHAVILRERLREV